MVVCSGCTSALETCPACENQTQRPACSFCRLPIQGRPFASPLSAPDAHEIGLSTTCAVCTHRTHVACLRKHVRATTKASPALADVTTTCPACPCRCFAEGGLSHATIPFRLSGTVGFESASASAPASRTTRSSVRGAVSPVPPLSPESAHSRLNYSSLANLTGVVQMLGPRERQKLARDSNRVQAQANAHQTQIGDQPATAAVTGRAGKPRGGEVLASSPENLMAAAAPASVSVNQTAAAGSSSSGLGAASGTGVAGGDGSDAPALTRAPTSGAGTIGGGGGGGGSGSGAGHVRAEGIWAKARGLTTEGFLTWTRGGDG